MIHFQWIDKNMWVFHIIEYTPLMLHDNMARLVILDMIFVVKNFIKNPFTCYMSLSKIPEFKINKKCWNVFGTDKLVYTIKILNVVMRLIVNKI